jgi:hypothetical protein
VNLQDHKFPSCAGTTAALRMSSHRLAVGAQLSVECLLERRGCARLTTMG